MKPFPARPDLALISLITLVALGAAITGAGLARGEAGPALSVRSPTTHTVEIRQLRFEPSRLTVRAGDTIVWINRDVVPHTVAPLDRAWSSGEMSQDESFRRVAGEATTLAYFCEYHPSMRAVVETE